ncbi:Metallo-hydrolase/oxidoreductase [Sarocladium strictum]
MKTSNMLARLSLVALALFAPVSRACDECDDVESASRLAGRSVASLHARQDLGNIFPVKEYPDQQVKNVTKYLAEARNLADEDLYAHFSHRCILNQVYPELSSLAQSAGLIRPAEIFKNVFFVGTTAVSAWAIDTGKGLLIIDTLNNAAEAEGIIIRGLESLGYSGEDIKWVLITHEHGDHFNGGRWLQDTYDPAFIASEAAWDGMSGNERAPVRNEKSIAVKEGQKVKFGNVQFTFHITPGHTPGTTSFFFPVIDHQDGTKHTVRFFGGLGLPRTAATQSTQISSLERFSKLAKKTGADVLMANHQLQDRSMYHFEILAHRECRGKKCNMPNPFVVGRGALSRYFRVQGLCVRTYAARLGLSLSV